VRKGKLFFAIITISFLASGCLGTRYLKDDEKLLFKQKIKVGMSFDNYELEQLLLQRPNRRIPVIRFSAYVWFYQLGVKQYDK